VRLQENKLKNLLFFFTLIPLALFGVLAGGRPNAISGGINAFAGVVNPANAVWIEDRFDVGAFVVHQRSFLDNHDDNPLFPPGKTNLNYKANYILTADAAFHKRIDDYSFSLALYSTPTQVKLRTKEPIPAAGTTPIFVHDKTQVLSAIFSFKLSPQHSIGVSADYFYLSHERKGFQRSDTPLRSVSPGHVTNNGTDHSGGMSLSIGWRWNITKTLSFGAAWVKKSYVGQFRKYRGFEPHHARNFIPQTAGMGFTALLTKRLAGRLEVLWSNLGDLPNANNRNTGKRGSNNSPGSGLQDATFVNLGFGYKVSEALAVGGGLSHRIRIPNGSHVLSHSYKLLTIYDILAVGLDYKYQKHDFFFSLAHGLKNRASGDLPIEIGGGKLAGSRTTTSFSAAWGYLY